MKRHTIRNLRRLNKIVVTLIRYGFGGIVSEIKVIPFLSSIERMMPFGKKGKGKTVGERIKLVLEELGPTFVKFGQIASTRADLLPESWIEELKKLQDSVSPLPFDVIKSAIEKNLHKPINEIFSEFNETPVASASIAQVHLARLLTGEEVAVKVRRPNIAQIIESDISVMYTIATLLEKHVAPARRYRPFQVVKEFSRVIHTEQDLTIEGANLSRFENIFRDDKTIQIPQVYWSATCPDVLTMERIHGVPIDEVEAIKEMGLDIKEVAINGVKVFFKQVFDHGVFHADLHPGNIFVRKDGVIIYLDFGIVGALDRPTRKYLANMLFSIVKRDYYKMALIHKEMGLVDRHVNIHEFEESLRDIVEPLLGRELENINISTLLMKLFQTAKKYNMVLQPSLLLLQKSMVIIEGVGRQLYPDANMWEVAKPLITKWVMKEKFSPKSVSENLKNSGEEITSALLNTPIQFNEVLKRVLDEDLKIGFEHHKLDPLSDEINIAGKKIAHGIIVGSLFLGSAIVYGFQNEKTHLFYNFPTVSLVGFTLAAIFSLKFIISDKKPSKVKETEFGYRDFDDYT